MRIELLYVDGCPNHDAVVARVDELLRGRPDPAEVVVRHIADDGAARRERFLGSPTVRVDGRDVEPGADRREDFGVKCRLYATPAGLRGMPPDEWLLQALDAAGSSAPGGAAGPAPGAPPGA